MIDGKRKILLYPDQDGIEEWREKMKAIGYNQMRLAKSLVIDPKNPKKDCGDFIVERLYEIDEQKKKKALSEEPTAEELERYNEEQCKLLDMISRNYVVEELINKIDLEIMY